MRTVFRRRWAAVLAFVMLFAGLAPAISHALASNGEAPFRLVEACTTQGMRVFAVAPDGSVFDEVPTRADNRLEHCSFCTLSMGSAPPPTPAGQLRVVEAMAFAPRLFLQAPHTLPAWRTTPARAPPLSL